MPFAPFARHFVANFLLLLASKLGHFAEQHMKLLSWFFAALGFSLVVLQAQERTNAPDYGPFFCATIKAPNANTAVKGIVVTVGDNKRAYICYDEDLLRASVGW